MLAGERCPTTRDRTNPKDGALKLGCICPYAGPKGHVRASARHRVPTVWCEGSGASSIGRRLRDEGAARLNRRSALVQQSGRVLHLLQLQRTAGNTAVAKLLRPPPASVPSAPVVQRSGPTTLDEAIRAGDSDNLDAFRPFAGINKGQLLSIVNIITTEGWVSEREEHILEEAWTSFGAEKALSETSYDLWKACEKRGADPKSVPWLNKLRTCFVPDVIRLAKQHLGTNAELVGAEMSRFGLPTEEGTPAAAPTRDQSDELHRMQEAAKTVADAQEEQELARSVYVGYSIDYPPPDGKAAWVPVTFDPFNPPQRTDPPPQPDPNDPSPMKYKTPVVKFVKTAPYRDLYDAYDAASQGIRKLVTIFPMLYGVSRHGRSADTRGFGDAADPVQARTQLGAALRQLLADINRAKGLLGGDLNPLDLRPVQHQLYAGVKTKEQEGDWSKQFAQSIAAEQVKDHSESEALKALGLEALSQMAFLLSSAVPGAGGLALMFVGLAATDVKAHISDTQYQAMATAAKTAVAPDTELVDPADLDRVKAIRDADQVALALAALNTAAAVADAMARAAKPALSRLGRRLAGGEQPALRGKSGELARADVGGGHEVKATDRGIERCSAGPCPLIGKFWENSLERAPQTKGRLEQAAQKARTDPVWAARDAAAADRSLQNLTAMEIDLWAASIPRNGRSDHPKFSELKRLPPKRADIADKPPTAAQLALIEKNVAEMKADGRVPPEYKTIPGALIPRELVTKVMPVLGMRVSDNAAVDACWKQAANDALAGRQLTPENYEATYKSAAGMFWNRVGRNTAAKSFFETHGFVIDGKTSAHLDVKGVHRQEVSLGLDHTFPKATGDNYKYALDGDKLQFLMQADNTKLSHLEKKDPTLRR
jgi:hypothetical protein